MDGDAVWPAIKGLARLGLQKVGAIAFKPGRGDIGRIADDHVDTSVQPFAGKRGKHVPLHDRDPVCQSQSVSIALCQSDTMLRVV